MDWIYSVDGHKVRLTSQRKTEEGKGEAGASSTATILSCVIVDGTHPLTAYIDDSVYVAATTRGDGEPDSNFAQSADASPAIAAAAPAPSTAPGGPRTLVAVAPPPQQSDSP